jgi:hypothetical protein
MYIRNREHMHASIRRLSLNSQLFNPPYHHLQNPLFSCPKVAFVYNAVASPLGHFLEQNQSVLLLPFTALGSKKTSEALLPTLLWLCTKLLWSMSLSDPKVPPLQESKRSMQEQPQQIYNQTLVLVEQQQSY